MENEKQNGQGGLWLAIVILFIWAWSLHSDLNKARAEIAELHSSIASVESKTGEIEATADEAKEKTEELDTQVEQLQSAL